MKSCRACRNWTGSEKFLDRDDPNVVNAKVQLRTCRRYAPRPLTFDAETAQEPKPESLWPLVPSDLWCGEYEPGIQ
jgi:hypothetical protein